MPAEKITADQLTVKIKALKGWTLKEKGIERNFIFKDFNDAFGFLARIALLSEKLNHHPEWSGVYNKVWLRLTTHEVGGLTQKDIDMAGDIDKLLLA